MFSIPGAVTLLALSQLIQANPTPQLTGTAMEKRNGCYGYSFGFNALHGGVITEHDLSGEVDNDINSFCQQAAGKEITASSPFWSCTNWQETFSASELCYDSCTDGCGAVGSGGRGGDLASGLCTAGCDPNCDPGPNYNNYNHIEWAIEARDGQPGGVISYDTCMAALRTEVGGCASGSEQVHDGYWFRIDPGSGACA
ncbi:hypothetical protein LTR27_002711 [Elasticomyces elasticus]|nr:hypothetical protein LTR27_002711 [Elasticomyces elasticus]